MNVLGKKVGQIVKENFIYARALHHLGVDFFLDENCRLEDLCIQKGIDKQRIIRSFYQFDSPNRISFSEIRSFPLELTLEYLRYAHYTYIKHHLPYIGDLVAKLSPRSGIANDLQIVFPLFVEDFIKHIYEEEDELFNYITFLIGVSRGANKNQIRQIEKFSSICLKELSMHHVDEDEMEGIRQLVENVESDDLMTHVIKNEIMAFDREILYHAAIENEILFPAAINLEESVFRQFRELNLGR